SLNFAVKASICWAVFASTALLANVGKTKPVASPTRASSRMWVFIVSSGGGIEGIYHNVNNPRAHNRVHGLSVITMILIVIPIVGQKPWRIDRTYHKQHD